MANNVSFSKSKMCDLATNSTRSYIMSRVHAKDTKPEMKVRRLLHSLGYRYRLHRRDLPGKPDIVFPSRRQVIFVHGCFWHLHDDCKNTRLPKTRQTYWLPKLTGNKSRDIENEKLLLALGWDVLVIWECELKNMQILEKIICSWLEKPKHNII